MYIDLCLIKSAPFSFFKYSMKPWVGSDLLTQQYLIHVRRETWISRIQGKFECQFDIAPVKRTDNSLSTECHCEAWYVCLHPSGKKSVHVVIQLLLARRNMCPTYTTKIFHPLFTNNVTLLLFKQLRKSCVNSILRWYKILLL